MVLKAPWATAQGAGPIGLRPLFVILTLRMDVGIRGLRPLSVDVKGGVERGKAL